MNLNQIRALFAGPSRGVETLQQPQATPSNVIPFQPKPAPDLGAVLDPETGESPALPARPAPPGLLDSPQMQAFFGENFLERGRRDGARLRSAEVLQVGKRTIVGVFQHSAAALIATLQARKGHLDLVRVRVEGVSAATTEQLLRELDRIGRDIELLEEQSRLSDEFKGWVLEAVNRYQLGFARGHQEAVDAELLFR